MRQNVTTDIIVEKKRSRKDGTHAVKLRITFQHIQKFYSAAMNLSEADFDKARGEKPITQYKELRIQMDALEKKAIDAIRELPIFSFEKFEQLLRVPKLERNAVSAAFDRRVADLQNAERLGTADSYRLAGKSLAFFKAKLNFNQVTPALS